MTKQWNHVGYLVMGTLLAIMAIIISMNEQNVNGQMMMADHGGSGNMTTGLQELQQKAMAHGTINLEQTIFKAIDSKVNISLTQAMTTAEKSVGNKSFAVAAFGGEYGGYFAYQIILGTPDMTFYNVLVDPGSGQILATQKVSAAELDKMHQEHSAEVVRGGSHGGNLGFPFLIPH
jgi:uncharacterized membrane protein YkoI